MSPFAKPFGIRVFEERTKRGMSLRKLAELSGIATSTISRVERGRYSPTYDNALRIAVALGIELDPSVSTEPSDLPTSTVLSIPENSVPPVENGGIAFSQIKKATRKNLSKSAAKSGYKMGVLLTGRLQIRSNTGFTATLTPGGRIHCDRIVQHTFFGIAAEDCELVWIA